MQPLALLSTQLLIGLPVLAVQCQSTTTRCEDVELPAFDGFRILAREIYEVYNYSLGAGSSLTTPINFCNITLALTHPGANDDVRTTIWLPLENWNGRFMATGGGGLGAGYDRNMPGPVALGYATGSTDAGLTSSGTKDPNNAEWALGADGILNTELIINFAHRSLHEMTLIGKAATKAFYGKRPVYSYYTGCSQGGRQGYYAAEVWPKDYDGIMANAPAIHTPRVSPADFWPSVVMANVAVPPMCVFNAYLQAIIRTCDQQDGVIDGLPSAPERCKFDPASLVGHNIVCADMGTDVKITTEYAAVISKIVRGARSHTTGDFLWFGTVLGADFSGLAKTKVVDRDTIVPVPFAAAEAWMRYFAAQNPDLDSAHLTFEQFDALFERSVTLYESSLGTSDPDLTAFRNAGGKLLTWHGMADPLIPHPGTTVYWQTLRHNMGGSVDDFYRIFLAPGAGHCGGGYGPVPVQPLQALVNWVECGEAPVTLYANTTGMHGMYISRNLCLYPRELRYKGQGDVHAAESFTCSCGPSKLEA